ncbi:hypothetical protein TrVE_jg12882 [Triparma verrucosa]|uniref:Uncharacterized protein n=1 Tax=Triparma verrucosa TaxID=1606542 RepID=A0A9W7FEN5_9STRA|nr:hypothetical protein TrVE_jg12882 [Triparma verrucosa]
MKLQILTLIAAVATLVSGNDESYGYSDLTTGNGDRTDGTSNAQGSAAPSWKNMGMKALRCVENAGSYDILWAFYYDGNRQCKFNYQATMSTPVVEFVKMYLEDLKERAEDDGTATENESEFEINEEYFECTAGQDAYGNNAYFQLGCSQESMFKIDLIPFATNACNTNYLSSIVTADVDSDYSSNIDLTNYQITFGDDGCSTCIDPNKAAETDADQDGLDEESVCEGLWSYSMFCTDECEMLGLTGGDNTWDVHQIGILVGELALFTALLFVIGKKRSRMPIKDRLIEEATAASVGFKRTYVFGIMIGCLILVAMLAAAKMVYATIGIMAFLNLVALGYLVKIGLFSK